ncbi:hypothetical protein F4803DRAFT_512904 [Xylaria telfairii]|nr:hypothetical protein F4803DRAFT_512904 [Xylaria telfairii]
MVLGRPLRSQFVAICASLLSTTRTNPETPIINLTFDIANNTCYAQFLEDRSFSSTDDIHYICTTKQSICIIIEVLDTRDH